MKIEEFHKALDDQFIMKKMDYRHIKRNKKYNLKEFIKKFKRSCDSDKEIYFYVKHKENKTMFFYEMERDKLLKVFEKSDKISYQKLLNTFSPIIEDEDELTSFMDMLIRLKHVEGYFSKFYFYPLDYIKKEVQEKISKKGIVNLKQYEKYLPPDFIDKVISEVEEESNQNFLMGKDGKTYYSIKSINSQINETAAKNNAVDLKAFRDRLTDVDFIKLIKNLPKEYLTNFHKGTIWLTNIGKINVIKEVENSKIIGFFDLKKVSEKLKIKKILLMDILALNVDFRSGLWDENGEVFYYSKFLKEKIDRISKIPDEQQKNKEINALATKYNIDKSHILTKIDENIQLIGEEIKNQDHIAISEYMEKTGMDRETFLEFINDLGLVYFKKGDQMIFDPSKIEQAKKELQNLLFQKFKSEDYIILGNFDITTDLVENLIKDLEKDDKIKGIFYEEGDELVFYTEKGIKNLMLNNQMLFSFRDLFYSKELTERDLLLMRELFEDLRNEKQLKGHFDEETLTFSSEEVIFASDYNAVVDKFSILVNGYAEKFNEEFEKVKRILTKRNKIIYPQEIKQIQDIIDKINLKYVKWRADIESTVMKANKKLLRDQGYTFKRYNGLATDKQEEIKLFKEDPDVYENIDNFEAWVSLFNELEISYGKIIFLQKKLINNPDDEQTEQELEELLERLSLI
ncbi:MAG: hypothetical protein EU548_10470 [Promethearchaeota archaeon]|nr:MAG: hypothetical protein EU548_10470 [Candidatus Lokiarchaeota archaeon]